MKRFSVGGGHLGTHDYALNLKVMEGVEGEELVSKDEVSEGYTVAALGYGPAGRPPRALDIKGRCGASFISARSLCETYTYS